MAGHSKWANIKHRKGAQDKKRGKIFTRCIREISMAARDGSPDPASNPALRLAIQNAKGANIPKDTIERAIQKGQGDDLKNLTPLIYEGKGPFGVGIILEVLTDNINRTVANIRTIFSKSGGQLTTNGSLDFIFQKMSVFHIPASQLDAGRLAEFEMSMIEAGASDMEENFGNWTIYAAFEDFGSIHKALDQLGIEATSAGIERIPNSNVTLNVENAKMVLKMIEKFEDDDDISRVFHNLELTDELAAELND